MTTLEIREALENKMLPAELKMFTSIKEPILDFLNDNISAEELALQFNVFGLTQNDWITFVVNETYLRAWYYVFNEELAGEDFTFFNFLDHNINP